MITAGRRGGSPQFESLLEKGRAPRIGPGRPRVRPDRVRADKAYASRKNRAYLRRRGIRCTIPDKAAQARNRRKLGACGGRPPHFDPVDYRKPVIARRGTEHGSGLGAQRWVAEKAFAHLLVPPPAFLVLGCALICRRRLAAVQRRHS
ncbi:transposase [Streptomyces sp. NPDC048590]|uniref:transposase n=1 Tax=Streptomyces sp. NPDC048590 TaxID=3365574 RepID=UPI0037113308